ncbi:MAG: dienelactone hydrolase family protein [Endozoicomonadaceae bacterium]|nr:dienelactone hydrolase family protein [Endozoicomonadaceae bacterium]
MQYLHCETVETTHNPTASVIWLHGLGASGHDFVPIIPELNLPATLGVRFIFPHAPQIPVTINNGMKMPAWYDILEMSIERKIDPTQIMQSAAAVIALVEREVERGIDSKRIILTGFSQGGAVCYEAALSYGKPLAALITMSTYFATSKTVKINDANTKLPIHIFHGTQDKMVIEAMGQHAKAALEEKNFKPSYKTYPMQHEVCLAEIRDISAFIQSSLA